MKLIKVPLPGGRALLACGSHDPNYPGISILIIEPDDESDGHGDVVAVAEYSAIGRDGPGVYIRAYTRDDDEPDYAKPYSLDSFNDLKVTDLPRQAIHMEWGDLGVKLSDLLTKLLHHEIEVVVQRSKYYNWEARLMPSITQEELGVLIKAGDAAEQKDLIGLSQGLCIKLMNKLLPFEASCTRADDAGVWFISLN